MKKEDIINKVRFYLHDTKKKLWQDDELERILSEAAKQYSADTAIFCGVFNIVPNFDNKFEYPQDYIHFICGWNKNGNPIEGASVHDIWDFDRKGDIESIYDDASSDGEFNIYPEQNIAVRHDIVSDDYGVYFHDYGLLEQPFDYGLVYSVLGYDFAGDIVYCRIADVEEIQDHTALIYKTLELAHCTESEFADQNMATIFRNSYNARTARFKQDKHNTAGHYAAGIFY